MNTERRERAQWRLMNPSRMFRAGVFATGLLCALLFSDDAKAAFAAERDLIGFNSTGTVFVFEQFGRQDGSGFPFSELFYITTANNNYAFLPVRLRIDDERKSIKTARRRARSLAGRLGKSPRGFESPGRLVASTSITQDPPPSDGVTFRRFFFEGSTKYEVALTEAAASAAHCANLTQGNEKKLKVTLKNLKTNNTKTLQDDIAIPVSRGCPTDYSISDVVVFDLPGDEAVIVVLVNVIRFGFEGSDRVFIGVSGKMN